MRRQECNVCVREGLYRDFISHVQILDIFIDKQTFLRSSLSHPAFSLLLFRIFFFCFVTSISILVLQLLLGLLFVFGGNSGANIVIIENHENIKQNDQIGCNHGNQSAINFGIFYKQKCEQKALNYVI